MRRIHLANSILAGVVLVFVATSSHSVFAEETVPGWSPSTALPPGELGKVVALGQEIVENTNEHPLSQPYVNNALTCSSCHLEAGTDPKAATFLDIASAYPAWSPRENRVITLEDRVLNCFMRSMNGVRPPHGSKVSVAVTAYITWLSSGSRLRMNPDKPLGPHHVPSLQIDPQQADLQRGSDLYAQRCADCHGESGQGSDEGPPTWGPRSFNDGAGLSRNDKLAAWLKVAMPLGDPDLSEQEALDIAAYINSHERPKFVLEEHLPGAEKLGEYNAESR
ncbi:c-type cytochrome [Rhodopirellula sp. JC639]|uniref:c-type cytochrome n=1 Tax=Stieleria mannarensis TaxID=2755585 RepID=UPI0015FECC0B|nr:c-type cytochrome [Rhodopirellula sp. JC639]